MYIHFAYKLYAIPPPTNTKTATTINIVSEDPDD